jgi:hypothetical protein
MIYQCRRITKKKERIIGFPVLDTGRYGRGSCFFATFRVVFDALAWGEEVRIKQH